MQAWPWANAHSVDIPHVPIPLACASLTSLVPNTLSASQVTPPLIHRPCLFSNVFKRLETVRGDVSNVLSSHSTLPLLVISSTGALLTATAVQGAMHVDPLYSAYHYSHPPLVDRLEAIDRAVKKKT